MNTRKLSILLSVIGIILVFVVYSFYTKSLKNDTNLPKKKVEVASKEMPPAPPVTFAQIMQGHGNKYLMLHAQNKDVFFVTGQEDFTDKLQSIEIWANDLRKSLKKAQHVNQDTELLYEYYSDFDVTLYFNGVSSRIMTDEKKKGKHLEVCVIPKDEFEKRILPSTPNRFWFNDRWGAIMVTGVEMPESFLVALMFYYFGNKEMSSKGMSSSMGDEFIKEMLKLHELEYQVLNHMSSTELEGLFEDIQSRSENHTDYNAALGAVTFDDLFQYDRILGLDKAGPMMAGLFLSEFYIALGLNSINAGDETENEKWEKKIAMYKMLSGR